MLKYLLRFEISVFFVWELIIVNFNDELLEFMINIYEFDMGVVFCFRC